MLIAWTANIQFGVQPAMGIPERDGLFTRLRVYGNLRAPPSLFLGCGERRSRLSALQGLPALFMSYLMIQRTGSMIQSTTQWRSPSYAKSECFPPSRCSWNSASFGTPCRDKRKTPTALPTSSNCRRRYHSDKVAKGAYVVYENAAGVNLYCNRVQRWIMVAAAKEFAAKGKSP